MRRLTILLALAILFVSAIPSHAAVRTERKTYVNVGGDFGATCVRAASAGTGGACFDIVPGETSVSILVQDQFTSLPAFRYAFKDAGGNTLTSGSSCWFGGSGIPAGATILWVYVSQLLAGSCSFTYVGEITVSFS